MVYCFPLTISYPLVARFLTLLRWLLHYCLMAHAGYQSRLIFLMIGGSILRLFFDPATRFILHLLAGSWTKCVHFTLWWMYWYAFSAMLGTGCFLSYARCNNLGFPITQKSELKNFSNKTHALWVCILGNHPCSCTSRSQVSMVVYFYI